MTEDQSEDKAGPALSELRIEAFRGLHEVKLEGLAWFNLLVGGTNSGKSSVLEAVGLIARPFDPGQWSGTALSRDERLPIVDALWDLFPATAALNIEEGERAEVPQPLVISGRVRSKDRKLSAIAEASTDPLPGWLLPEDEPKPFVRVLVKASVTSEALSPGAHKASLNYAAGRSSFKTPYRPTFLERVFLETSDGHRSTAHLLQAFQPVDRAGGEPKIVELLRTFDGSINGVRQDNLRGTDTLRVLDVRRGSVPLSSFGDGVRRAFGYAATLLRARGGVLLIDELETGIHREVLGRVIAWLARTARELGVQVFATTHSLDAVDAVLEACEERGDAFVAFRLRREEQRVVPVRLTHRRLANVRHEGLDIR